MSEIANTPPSENSAAGDGSIETDSPTRETLEKKFKEYSTVLAKIDWNIESGPKDYVQLQDNIDVVLQQAVELGYVTPQPLEPKEYKPSFPAKPDVSFLDTTTLSSSVAGGAESRETSQAAEQRRASRLVELMEREDDQEKVRLVFDRLTKQAEVSVTKVNPAEHYAVPIQDSDSALAVYNNPESYRNRIRR